MRPEEINQRCIERLNAAGVGRGEYVAVVGAGPSSPVVPAGKALVKEVADACGMDPNDERPFWEFFEEAKQKNKGAFCDIINRNFCEPPFWTGEIYQHIVAIRFKSFVTLNYDDCLQQAFAKSEGPRWKGLFSVYPPHRSADGTVGGFASPSDFNHKRRLVAIHGFRDLNDPEWPDKKIILTRSDYNEHYFSPDKSYALSHWWQELLVNHDCLFIGTSLMEPGLRSVIEWLIKDENTQFLQRRHLHLKDVRWTRTEHTDGRISEGYPPPKSVFGVVSQIQYDPKARFVGLQEVLAPFSHFTSETDFEPGMAAPIPISPSNSKFFE